MFISADFVPKLRIYFDVYQNFLMI